MKINHGAARLWCCWPRQALREGVLAFDSSLVLTENTGELCDCKPGRKKGVVNGRMQDLTPCLCCGNCSFCDYISAVRVLGRTPVRLRCANPTCGTGIGFQVLAVRILLTLEPCQTGL